MAVNLPDKINLEIVTPARQIFCGEVDEVSLPGKEGYLGILPGHAPLLSELRTGVISYKIGDEEQRLFCGWGFVEILSDRVSILTEKAALPDEIDISQAKEDRARADTLLKTKAADYKDALELWESAVARLQTVRAS